MDYSEGIWVAVGLGGAFIFYGRFYVQWIASEIRKRSVVPVAFWYMSATGSILLLSYAVYSQSPVGALGQSFNMVIYGRNLIHIRREKGKLTKTGSNLLHAWVGTVATVAVLFAAWTWLREWKVTGGVSAQGAAATWMWLMVGLAGQALFALRFLVQWLATERAHKSVIPKAFWYISTAAATLMLASFLQRAEWIFAGGVASTLLIYLRNIHFIHQSPHEERPTLDSTGP